MPYPLRALCLAAGLMTAFSAFAQEETSAQLRERATAIREAADKQHKLTNYHCYDKFLVNACLDDAQVEYISQVKEARLLEAKANRIDRAERVKAMEARLRKMEARPDASTAPAETAAPAPAQ